MKRLAPVYTALLYPGLLGLILMQAACQSLPPRAEMLEVACAEQACRDERRILLYDASGTAREFRIPAGPVFAGGVLSIAQGEAQYLAVSFNKQGEARLRWVSPAERESANVSFRLEQLATGNGHASRLSIRNQTDRTLWIEAEQFPVNESRFYPLALSPVPAGQGVSRQWPYTILEIQITGLRALTNQERSD